MKHLIQQNSLWLIYINYHTPDEITIKKLDTIIQELHEHYRTADEQCSMPIFSANLVAIPSLYAVKYIQVKKHFLITPQNQTRQSNGDRGACV